jgi:prepilin signal peptidase PulO-like enzyme (type II secretory pathway)
VVSVVTELLCWTLFVFGLVVGSFLNVVGYRIPRGESIVHPRSHCPQCERPLSFYELIPVLSWLGLKGRCNTCHGVIPVRYPIVELVTGSLFAATVLTGIKPTEVLATCVFWMFMAAVTVTDITAMRVPNVLSLPGALVVFVLVVTSGIQTWSHSLVGALTGFAVMFAIHLLSGGNMGLGDVKLYLMIGALFGPLGAVESIMAASALGSLTGISLRLTGLLPARSYIPFVPYIFAGTILVYFFGPSAWHWYVTSVLHLSY